MDAKAVEEARKPAATRNKAVPVADETDPKQSTLFAAWGKKD